MTRRGKCRKCGTAMTAMDDEWLECTVCDWSEIEKNETKEDEDDEATE